MSAPITLEPGSSGEGGTGNTSATARARISVTTEDGRTVVLKRATGTARPALRREGSILRAAAGPEVVRILDVREDDDATELVLAHVRGPSLAALLADPQVDAAAALLAVAEACGAVARFHGRGWAHGRLSPDHVLAGPRGRMRLCSLGVAGPPAVDPAAARRDRAALLRTVDRWTERPPAGASRRRRIRHAWVAGKVRRRTHRLVDDPDPLVLARILRRAAGRRRRHASPMAVRAPRPASRRGPIVAATLGAAATVATVATVASLVFGPHPRPTQDRAAPRSSSAAAPAAACGATTHAPDVDGDGCADEVRVDGTDVTVDGRTYRVGRTGDVVAVGDWDCDGTATALVLRPSTGELYEFADWARPGAPAAARPAGLVPGGRDLTTEDRCGDATVVLADGARRPAGITP